MLNECLREWCLWSLWKIDEYQYKCTMQQALYKELWAWKLWYLWENLWISIQIHYALDFLLVFKKWYLWSLLYLWAMNINRNTLCSKRLSVNIYESNIYDIVPKIFRSLWYLWESYEYQCTYSMQKTHYEHLWNWYLWYPWESYKYQYKYTMQ